MRFEVTITLPGAEPVVQVVEFRTRKGVEHFVGLQAARLERLGGEVTWRDVRDSDAAAVR